MLIKILDKKLEKEIPIIMKMCITGYLWAVNKYGDKGIWKILTTITFMKIKMKWIKQLIF